MKCKFFFIKATLSVIMLYTMLLAGTTGKIIGTVYDAQTSEPLPGANIYLENTTLGAASDGDGQFAIMNIQPGTYVLVVNIIGYKEVRMENVRVMIDLTTTLNFELQESIVEGEVITIIAERPLVQMDATSTFSSVSADDIQRLPAQSIADVLELQAGLVRDGNGFHIRGGRSSEAAYWIDGMSVTDVYGGGMAVDLENNSIEEIQVISGTFNAEYGQAMSGIINQITKEGSKEYTGSIRTYVGDYYSTHGVYDVLDDIRPPEGVAVSSTNPLSSFNPVYNVELNLNGPLPFSNKKLTFFLNGRYFSDEGYLYGREWRLPQGIPGNNDIVAMNPYEKFSGHGKLTFHATPLMKLNYSFLGNTWNADRSFSHDYKYNPLGTAQRKGYGMTHIFEWNHTLNKNTFYAARFMKLYTEYQQYVYEDPTKTIDYLGRVNPDSLHLIDPSFYDIINPDGTYDYKSEKGQALDQYLRENGMNPEYVANPANPEGYVHPDSQAIDANYSYSQAGMDMSHYFRSTSSWVGKLDFNTQINKDNLVKAGIEYQLHDLTQHGFTLLRKMEPGGTVEITPFEPWTPPLSSIYNNRYKRKPIDFSAYLQDKLEMQEIFVNFGVRFDYFDPQTVVPADPSDPDIYYPIKDKHIYKNWVEPDQKLTPQEEEAYKQQFTEYTPEERRAFMHKDVTAKTQLSPRLGIGYPISSTGKIYFSYGHFFKRPDYQYLYSSPDFKLRDGEVRLFGNPDLNAEHTVKYEIGLQQQLAENLVIDATVYYSDIRDWVGTGPKIETASAQRTYYTYENKDYANVRGIILIIEKRFANSFSAKIDYQFQVAEGTYSNPSDAYNSIQNNESPLLALTPLNWEQRHTVSGVLNLMVRKWMFSFVGKYHTGQPYTPGFTSRAGAVGGTTFRGWRDNSQYKPNISSMDLYINRKFNIYNYELAFFITVYNLLDQKGQTGVYSDTGVADYSTYIDPSYVSYNILRNGTIDDYRNRPEWYIAPRQMQMGVSFTF
jgi:outer membrane receptor protein involved in Fe transport